MTQLYQKLRQYAPLKYVAVFFSRVDRRCHGDDSTEAGWMLAIRAELKAGQQIVMQRLMEARCAGPFLRAGNTEVVRQDGKWGSPSVAVAAQPMSALKKGEAGADRDPEEKTNNTEAAEAALLGVEAAKRKLDFDEVRAPKFKGVPSTVEESAETPTADEGENVSKAGDDVLTTGEERGDDSNCQSQEVDDKTKTSIAGVSENLSEASKVVPATPTPEENKAVSDAPAGNAGGQEMASESLIRDCSVKLQSIDNMLPPGLMEKVKKRMIEKSLEKDRLDEILAAHPEVRKCTVQLKDLRNHPWYGSKISGMTPCESSSTEVEAEIKEELDSDEEVLALVGSGQTGGEEEQLTDSDEEVMDTLENIDAQIEADEDSDSDEAALATADEIARVLDDSRERERVLDLTGMKASVDNGEYSRVLSFHLAFKQVLATVHVPGPGKALARNAIKKVYKSAMALAFPWFDVSNPAANYEANSVEERMVRPPDRDHVYADRRLTAASRAAADGKADEQSEISEQVPRWKKYRKRSRAALARDTRKCLFCHQLGDADNSRLIYFRQNGELIRLRAG